MATVAQAHPHTVLYAVEWHQDIEVSNDTCEHCALCGYVCMTLQQRLEWLTRMMNRWRDRNWSMYLAFQHEYLMLTWDYVRATSRSGVQSWPNEEQSV